jgi:hypothetical protein
MRSMEGGDGGVGRRMRATRMIRPVAVVRMNARATGTFVEVWQRRASTARAGIHKISARLSSAPLATATTLSLD